MMNKNNVPYYIAGTLATFTLLASRVFAAAPYIGFLAPVAALSVGLPFIIGYAVFSVVIIALSYKAISKNKTISEKDGIIFEKEGVTAEQRDTLALQKQTNSKLEAKIQAQEQTISEKDAQLSEKEKEISGKDAKLVDQAKEIEDKDKIISKRDTKVEKNTLKMAITNGTVQLAKGTVNGAVSLTKGAANGTRYFGKYAYDNYVPSTESAKEKLSNASNAVGNSLKVFIMLCHQLSQ